MDCPHADHLATIDTMKSSAALRLREPSARKTQLSPPLKWAGGKRWLVPVLSELYEPFRKQRLVEPFLGGMAVALGLAPRKALLADVNPHAVNFYRWLQKGLQVSLRMKNERETFNRLRDRFNSTVLNGGSASAEAAGLFYYLNRTGFNGLCRFNGEGRFNVPFGKYQNINYTRDFRSYRAALKNWQFKCCDFESLKIGASDFVYADPPYDVEFTRYSQRDFTWDDQVRLAEWLARHAGPTVASNQATDRICALYRKLGFRVHKILARRLISCNGDRTPALEILAIRNIPLALQRRVLG